VLAEEEPGAFAWEPERLTWRGRTVTLEQVAEARRSLLGFGSCSFDEPRDALRELGWIPAP